MFSRFRIAASATLIGLAVAMASPAAAQRMTSESASAAEDSVKKFLQAMDDAKTTRYIAVFRDLNGDGATEAIVYLIGNEWCGSGGCSMLILARAGASWRIVTRTTITQTPVRVLATTSNGWHSLGVWVQGGGIQPGYEAELRFNGKAYPKNPSVPPARRLKGETAGEVVIASAQNAISLYPDRSKH